MTIDRLLKFPLKIYFYCDPVENIPIGNKFQHLIICLAEGFQELGIPFFSNVNYWQNSLETSEYLFQHYADVTPDDCSIVIFTTNSYVEEPLPKNLFHPQRQYITVYLDCADGDKTYNIRPEFRQFDLILRTHFNSKLNYGNNFHPWVFGLSNRILQELNTMPDFTDRKRQILVNFRHWKSGHPVRNISCSQLIPKIQNILTINNFIDDPNHHPQRGYHYLQWLQTGSRHYPNYYKRLQESIACTCFGGFFVTTWPSDPGNLVNRGLKQLLAKLKLQSNTILQWDSWRFWESLAAGCVTFHVDFEKYGIALPVMPENWRHYIGIDLDNVQATIDKIAENPEILEYIAQEGRNWAIKHYSPVPTALRLLEIVSQKQTRTESSLFSNPTVNVKY
jgi:hypothetical protein